MLYQITKLLIQHGTLDLREHSAKVALQCHSQNNLATLLALAHDLVEDTVLTLDDVADAIRGSLPECELHELVTGLEAITRVSEETYVEYIDRVSLNQLATDVKIADLKVNIKRCSEEDTLLKRYEKALQKLTQLEGRN